MHFLFVDRVLELERDTRLVAVRQLPLADEIFTHHFPGRPMLPASLLIEALAQAATILIEASREFRFKAIPGYVENAKFRAPVVPGHEMRIEVDAERTTPEGVAVRGVVWQRDKRCVTAALGMVTAPLTDFYPPAQAPFYRALYEKWLAETACAGFDRNPLELLRHG